jgi:uncharacterized protein
MIRAVVALVLMLATVASAAAEAPLKVLFLGDTGHHRPAERFAQLQPVLTPRGIELVYTENLSDLDPAVLAAYDALAVYANIDNLPSAAEAAILDFVRNGKGLVPLHCASFCFRNSPAWIDLVGAQFQKHGTGEFRTANVAPEHPLMKGFGGFQSWDETAASPGRGSARRARAASSTRLGAMTSGRGGIPASTISSSGAFGSPPAAIRLPPGRMSTGPR